MENIVVEKITLELGRVPSGDEPAVRMRLDGEEYILLTIKTSILAAGMVKQLEEEFRVLAIIGMAFDYWSSVEQSKLVLFPDPKVNGIYVRVADFEKTRFAFNT